MAVESLRVVHPPLPAAPAETTALAPAVLLGLLGVERAAVVAMVADGDGSGTAHVTQVRATAFASDDGVSVRRRSLAKALAVAEQQMMQLSALFAAAVAQGKLDVLGTLDKAATGATRRFVLLADALRADEERNRRPAVFIAAANAVTIGGAHER